MSDTCFLLSQPTKGDYVLRVQVSGYSNPRNTCVQCQASIRNPRLGCCDRFTDTDGDCELSDRCDNQFFTCLMPFQNNPSTVTILSTISEESASTRGEELGCSQPPAALNTTVLNMNGEAIDFSSGMFLGLPNPLEFEVTADRWQVRS